MKSTLFNMVMVLFVITLLASAGVGAVHMITEEPIAEARVKATREALKQVLPEFDETEVLRDTIENLPVTTAFAGDAVCTVTRRSGCSAAEEACAFVSRVTGWS